MRTLPVLSLLLIACAADAGPEADDRTVRDEELNFEVRMPDSIDWDKGKSAEDKRDYVKARFHTFFAGTDPLATADVELWVLPLPRPLARKDPIAISSSWRENVEASLTHTRDVEGKEGTLGGAPCWSRSLKGEYGSGVAHLTWDVAKMGNYVYVFYAFRTYDAVGDKLLEEEIKEIRDSFKFLRQVEVEAHKDAGKGDGPAPGPGAGGGDGTGGGADAARTDPTLNRVIKVVEDFWRYECVKPKGLRLVDPKDFDEAEIANNVRTKMTGESDQSLLLIRVYAQTETAQRWTIEQLAERYLKDFETKYPEKARLEPEVDKRYRKVKLAEEAIRMKLIGRRRQSETTIWVLAQCKNQRQYVLQIYYSGSTGGEIWKDQIEQFLKSFEPKRR